MGYVDNCLIMSNVPIYCDKDGQTINTDFFSMVWIIKILNFSLHLGGIFYNFLKCYLKVTPKLSCNYTSL